ncbi:MAG: hypothetical protein OXG29_03675 [Gammaproteobacteria bacterium]|nr:hypothetical protein [Gammaproteobacteria bacterium]
MDLLNDLIKDPFGAAAARELCRRNGLFEPGRLYRRIEISETLRKEFVRRGGASGTTNAAVATVLKKWLLTRASPFRREMRGRYRFLGLERENEGYAGAGVGGFPVRDAPMDYAPTPELEIGAGPCEVYAWCMPGYKAAGDGRWPIRIGRAGTEGFKAQLRDFHENLPERPRYLLRLGCADDAEARRREALLQAWFTERGQQLDEAPGDGWFLANPGQIDEAAQHLMEAELHVGGMTLERMDKLFAEIFKDVPDEEWANLPDDLIDRLDGYLYGVDRYRQ